MRSNTPEHNVAIRARFALGVGIWLSGALIVSAVSATEWSATPYRVKCVVLLDDNPELRDTWRDRLPIALAQVVRADVKQLFHLKIDVLAAAAWRIDDLSQISNGNLRQWEPAAPSFDKVFVVIVDSDARDIQLGCVEWDARTRSFSEVTVDRNAALQSLHLAAGKSLLRVFRPIGRIVRVERTSVTLEMRAGWLLREVADDAGLAPPRERALPPEARLEPGEILQPVNCRLNRLGEITDEGTAAVPWTMLRVAPWPEDPERAAELVQCEIDSGLRSPFRVRSSRRVERYALTVRPSLDKTTFRFESATSPGEPLVGYELHSRRLDQTAYELEGSSDRLGQVVVAKGDQPYRMIYVKHGNLLLARLPCLVGLQPEIKLTLPDYAERLKAEAFARGMEDDLLDAIVQRELVVAAFHRRLAAEKITVRDLEAAAGALRKIERLNRPDGLFRELQRREAAYRSNNPIVQKRIDMLFHDLRQTIRASMEPKFIAKLQAELAEAQSRLETAGEASDLAGAPPASQN